jgi:hypothetical protein
MTEAEDADQPRRELSAHIFRARDKFQWRSLRAISHGKNENRIRCPPRVVARNSSLEPLFSVIPYHCGCDAVLRIFITKGHSRQRWGAYDKGERSDVYAGS